MLVAAAGAALAAPAPVHQLQSAGSRGAPEFQHPARAQCPEAGDAHRVGAGARAHYLPAFDPKRAVHGLDRRRDPVAFEGERLGRAGGRASTAVETPFGKLDGRRTYAQHSDRAVRRASRTSPELAAQRQARALVQPQRGVLT